MEDHSQKTESKWVAPLKKAFGVFISGIMKVFSRKGRAVESDKHKKKWLKHLWRLVGFTIVAILFFVVALCWLAPFVESKFTKNPLSPVQLAYGLFSAIIAVALYVWGVGNWSRFEPPKDSPDSTNKSSEPKTTPTPTPGGVAAAPGGAPAPGPAAAGNAPATPQPGTPVPPKGAN